MIDFISMFIPFLIATIYISKIYNYCIKNNVMDVVTARSAHKTPTPRGGGLLFVFMITPFGLIYTYFAEIDNKAFIYALLIGSLLIAYTGWLDDIKNKSARIRFTIQICVIAVCLYFLPQLYTFAPLWLEKLLLAIAWIWFLNLFNFSDGLDGFAASGAIFIAISISFLNQDIKPLLLVLGGTCLGFLRMNWAPAKIFMGDVGSTYLGFVIGGIMFDTATIAPIPITMTLLTLTLLYTADITSVLIIRTAKGHSPLEPHREFWFHRAAKAGLSHGQVVIRAMAINLLFLTFSIAGLYIGNIFSPFLLALCVLAIVAYRIRKLEGK